MPLDQRPKSTSLASKAKQKKRAREDDGGARPKRRKAAFEQEELDFDLEAGLNKKLAFLDSMLLADHLAQKTRRFGTDLKPVELSALDISREFLVHDVVRQGSGGLETNTENSKCHQGFQFIF
jgi:protein CMS1